MKLNEQEIFLTLLKGQGYEHKGEFDATAVYEKTTQRIDCFTYLGTSYYTKKTAPVGTLPTNTEYFGILASGNGAPEAVAFAEAERLKSEEKGNIVHQDELNGIVDGKAEADGSNIDKEKFNKNLQNDWVNKYQKIVSSATTTWTSVDLYDYFDQQDGLFEILLTTEMYNNASGSNKGFYMYTDCAGNETNYISLHYEWKYDTSRETCIVPVKRYIYFKTGLKTSGDYEIISARGYRRIK